MNVLTRSTLFASPTLLRPHTRRPFQFLSRRFGKLSPLRSVTNRYWQRRELTSTNLFNLSCKAPTDSVAQQRTGYDVNTRPDAIYIHLPFCAQRCGYCAFTVVVSGRTSLPHDGEVAPISDAHQSYVDLLCAEIRSFFDIYYSRLESDGEDDVNKECPLLIRTVYFGGGTPSLIHPLLFSHIMSTLRAHVVLSPDVEITCEMDPATFTADSARSFMHSGVNRVSIGVQSFDDDVLRACGRIHRRRDIEQTMMVMDDLGMTNVSMDLICSLPYQSLSSWKTSLNAMLVYAPSHISVYDLTLEPNTLFATKYKAGVYPLPSHTHSSDMLASTHAKLSENGYEHYEISNFAKGADFVSRHNLNYWNNRPFVAFGVGATSLVDNFRFQRPTRMSSYAQYVESLDEAREGKVKDEKYQTLFPQCERMKRTEVFEDFVINGMRLLQQGVKLEQVKALFGTELEQRLANAVCKCNRHETDGHLIVARTSEGTIDYVRLSETGLMIENSIVSDILLEAVWR